MRIQARFNGKCANCERHLDKGSEIEYVDKKAYCIGCGPDGEREPQRRSGVTAEELAESLGYVRWDDAGSIRWSEIRSDRVLQLLRSSDQDSSPESERENDGSRGFINALR